MLMWEIAHGDVPFAGADDGTVARWVQAGNRPEVAAGVPAEYAGLMRHCWAHKPQDRPSCKQIVQRLQMLATAMGSPFSGGQVTRV